MKTQQFIPRPSLAVVALGLFYALGSVSAAPDVPLNPDLQNVAGIPNFHAVNERIYRGGQPTAQGLVDLSRLGIKTVLNLREEDESSKYEKKLVKELGMRYVHVPMKGMSTPSDKQISKALHVLDDADAGPVFVHCQRGADRTGAVIACYRVKHDNWKNAQALAEARKYGLSWYQFQLQRYVSRYEPRDSITDGITEKTVDLGRGSIDLFKKLGTAATDAIGKVRH